MKSIVFFVLAAVFEIAGCFSFWGWLRQQRSTFWLIPGVISLVCFAVLLTRVDAAFAGRAYAAYGGIYVAASVAWLWLIERQAPDRWDIVGSLLCIGGCLIVLFGPRTQ
jgi:small multidrug resistance family-3 protein